MQTFYAGCKKQTDNVSSKKVIMRNKVIRDKSRCANCMSNKSRFLKQKHNRKVVGIMLILKFLNTSH